MLKYKRKRFIKYTIAVIVPIFTIAIIALVLHYTNRVDLSEIDIVSTTQNLFSNEDTLSEKHDKMAEKETLGLVQPSTDSTKTPNDSITLLKPAINHFEGKSVAEYLNIDTVDLKKDVLVATKKYTIPVDIREMQLDSLLMNRTNIPSTLQFTIEFWQSPINFKGYKLSINKAIIYGISDIDNCELYIDNKQYYLIINTQLFLMEPTDVFKKLTELTL